MLNRIDDIIYMDKISKVLKNTYKNIDSNEWDNYSDWDTEDYKGFSVEERFLIDDE